MWGFRSVGAGSASAICKALRTDEMSPQILSAVHSSNPGLHFLHSCLARLPVERPSAAFVAKRMEECIRQGAAVVVVVATVVVAAAAAALCF